MKIGRVSQKPGHCGAASLEMLFLHYNVALSQDDIVRATKVPQQLWYEGFRIDELSEAVASLNSEFIVVGKFDNTLEDLKRVLENLQIPVGVEWQGMFIDANGRYFEEGHYSVITAIDENNELIHIIDPDDTSAIKNGIIKTSEFLSRWWEMNSISQEFENVTQEDIRNEGLMFIVVPLSKLAEIKLYGFEEISIHFLLKNRK